MNNNIPKFVLTGGPCSGKTVAIPILKKILLNRGVTPIFVPETPTLILESGINIKIFLKNKQLINRLQRQFFKAQLMLEEIWEEVSSIYPAHRKVLILDRGIIDQLPYTGEKKFESIARNLGYTVKLLRDRYQAVFHLVTAASGAEEFYNFDNPARFEGIEEARQADQATRLAWQSHKYFRIIDNVQGGKRVTFDRKLEKLVEEVLIALDLFHQKTF